MNVFFVISDIPNLFRWDLDIAFARSLYVQLRVSVARILGRYIFFLFMVNKNYQRFNKLWFKKQ